MIWRTGVARRMHASGEPVTTIADALGVSRATVYRVLAEEAGSNTSS
jgi:DNA invertase Pin-like site-specific DNA recombinase